MSDRIEEYKKRIIEASYKAVDDLILVLETPIFNKDDNGFDTVAAEKMKLAASAKRLAQEDALAMLNTAQKEEEELNGEKPENEPIKVKEEKVDFKRAESRASGRT